MPAEPLTTRSVQRKDPPNESGVSETYAQPQALCPVCFHWTDVSPDVLISWEPFVCGQNVCLGVAWVDGENKQFRAAQDRRRERAA